MKHPTLSSRSRQVAAFTLIELLIVIAIIAILAGLLFPIMAVVAANRAKSVARAELHQVQASIEAYKAKKGMYPPDSPTNVLYNPLYLELVGTVVSTPGGSYYYTTLDGSFTNSATVLMGSFGISNLVNTAASARGSDDNAAPEAFLKDIKPTQIGTGPRGARILVCSEGFAKPGAPTIAPWRYNASHPTNNPSGYDLWVDLYIRGKTNRISNWSKDPEVVP